MDYLKYNREAWNAQVRAGNKWTVPVDSETVERARHGDWQIILTPQKPVPRSWLDPIEGKRVLCLAGGGGQQAPILAAAGAIVTTLDNSENQLEQDQAVARRENLTIGAVQGDMADLSAFKDESFDLIVHPCSNCFVPDLHPVWREAFRVLRSGGRLMTGFTNPIRFIFDDSELQKGNLVVRHKIPYSDTESLTESELQQFTEQNEPIIYGHSLSDQINGQLKAGFQLIGFYEDDWAEEKDALSKYMESFCATYAQKP